MAALSPRSANIPAKIEPHPKKGQLDAKVATLRALEREKDHPPPPPAIVKEPSTTDGGEGEEYSMGRCLGKGGFAICYEGEARGKGQAKAGQLYALKIVKSAMPQPNLAEKFKTELQIHSKMFHPHIVEFHRAFTYGGSTYIVLQLCSNGSLMEMVKQRKFLSEPEVRRYVIQISGAIKYLHHKNVIHRDLKMGNIFLDEQMNAKIGDFGLAALLLSQSEYSLNRRRTMCGTPNYIAPEVLAKGWKGHDHKVDIWSLGIIIFAMLSGYPPFQSKTQEEIYRKVKARSYLWPSTDACANNISQQAKDLVASLLVDATERPEPDDLVCHAFFRAGVIPHVMTPLAKCTPPTSQEWSPQTGVDEEAWRYRQWMSFCRKCGVGRNQMGHAFPAAGEELNKSTYKECLLEEKAGKFPVVPIPQHTIYKRFVDPNHWSIPNVVEMTQASLGIVSEPADGKILPTQSASNPPLQSLSRPVQPTIKRQEAKSHAAQLRERDIPKRRVQEVSKTGLKWNADGKGLSYHKEDHNQGTITAAAASTGSLSRNPVRSNSQGRLAKASIEQPTSTRITRSQSTQALGSKGIGAIDGRLNSAVVKPSSIRHREYGTGGGGGAAPARPAREARKVSSYDQRRSKVVLSPVEETTEDEKPRGRGPVAKPAAAIMQVESNTTTPAPVGNLLIDPTEPAVFTPHTQARDVLIRLSATLDSLRTALNRRQPNRRIAVRRNSSMPLVTKWVDYSNKFGIGYTLSDGSMGCLLNGEANYPSSGVYVRGDIDRTPIIISSKRGGPTGSKGDQPIPLHGRPVELYENHNERGFKNVVVTKEVYRFLIDGVKATGVDDDVNAKKSPSQRVLTPSDLRKRRAILLWGRFANYMRDSLAKGNSIADVGEAPQSTEKQNDAAVKSAEEVERGLCVLFYQRLGNVGIWGFSDGGFQFNFPDHTKLVISQGATLIDFYHLPEPAALQLSSTSKSSSSASSSDGSLPIRPISRQDLNDRGIISLAVRDIVCSSLSSVAKANQLEQKLTFVVSVLQNWLENGGLGKIGGAAEARRIRWEGMSESVPSTTATTTTVEGNDKKVEGQQAPIDNDGDDNDEKRKKVLQQKKKRREPNGDVWVSIGALSGDSRYS